MSEGYGFLFAFFVGLACGAVLDWFRRALDRWAQRQEEAVGFHTPVCGASDWTCVCDRGRRG